MALPVGIFLQTAVLASVFEIAAVVILSIAPTKHTVTLWQKVFGVCGHEDTKKRV
jgi:hypothetical protein